ncbi:MAG: hypothetical protein M3297_02270 [Thermoproteota archaeon]|nr:hypothetical protein [Thermoproteota archaeon]
MRGIDLCIRDPDISSVKKVAKLLNIEIIGTLHPRKTCDEVIYRLQKKPSSMTDYRYLVVAESIEQFSRSSLIPNLIVVSDFQRIKTFVKNRKYKSKIALEVLLSDIRYEQGISVGRWFREVTDLYKFTKQYGYQFVLSSGANSISEMISAQCIESIMKICEIPPQIYWRELEDWITQQDTPRFYA